jgi:hypothetical protein
MATGCIADHDDYNSGFAGPAIGRPTDMACRPDGLYGDRQCGDRAALLRVPLRRSRMGARRRRRAQKAVCVS